MAQQSDITFQIFDDHEQMSMAAANFMFQCVLDNPGMLLCAASGNSPAQAYGYLAGRIAGSKWRSPIKVMTLDEWVGLPQESRFSSALQINNQLIGPLDLKDCFLFRGDYKQEAEEIGRAEAYLRSHGPVELCVLGIGTNGHLGFNEPGGDLQAGIHTIRLTEESRGHTMVAEASFKPEYGITLGVRDILQSKKILLLVSGAHKRAIMERFMTGRISTHLPASFLWLHPNVTCMCDKAAMPGGE